MNKDITRFFGEINTLIERNQIPRALQMLRNYVSGNSTLNDQYEGKLIMLMGRYNGLQDEYFQKLITQEYYTVEKTRLSEAILYFVEQIKEDSEELTQLPAGKYDEDIPMEIAPPPPQVKVQLQKNISNKLKNISWLEKGITYAKSVCKVEVRNKPTEEGIRTIVGTGFLLPGHLLMTNNHVIGSTAEAADSVLYFNYQLDAEDNKQDPLTYKLAPEEVFFTNEDYDFSIIKVKDEPKRPLDQFGHVNIDLDEYSDEPALYNHVTIIQHPMGGYKQIALNENQITKVDKETQTILYKTDTEEGSSGSPVFNDNWKVIGLHHAHVSSQDEQGVQTFHNKGVMMEKILDILKNEGILQ
ncbi:MAG: serine protease [Bacteroidetes bacterium]|nr:MAG: serine protease [Bacteroidota bacterium]